MTATMSWELDREHEEFRASVRSFVDRQVRPVVEESEEAGRPPAALLKEMGSAGLLGLAVPGNPAAAAPGTPSPSCCCPRSWPGPAAASPSPRWSPGTCPPRTSRTSAPDEQRARYLPAPAYRGRRSPRSPSPSPAPGRTSAASRPGPPPCRRDGAEGGIPARRHQDVHHQRRDRRRVRGRAPYLAGRAPRHHHVHRRGRQSRAVPSAAAPEDGLARLLTPARLILADCFVAADAVLGKRAVASTRS